MEFVIEKKKPKWEELKIFTEWPGEEYKVMCVAKGPRLA